MSLSIPSSRNSDSENGADKEIDIVEHWRDYTIEDALSDADEMIREKLILLKDQKPRNLKLKKPPTKKQLRACKLRQIKQSQQKVRPRTSPANDSRKCPLRILELAAPTKRHCMETVKGKYHILPAHMMYRLKQYVYDKMPIFPIPDALKCFEQKKKSSKKKHRKQECMNAKTILKRKDMAIFCAIFGYRTSQMLLPCLKFDLTPELQKICSVVYRDVENIMKEDSTFKSQKHHQYLTDTSEKITFWISSILDDAYFNQIEDDIKDMRIEEVVAWHILEDLIRIVLETCIPWSPDEDSEQGSDSENIVSNEDHIRNEIQKIIDGITEEVNEPIHNYNKIKTIAHTNLLDKDISQEEIKDLLIADRAEITEDPEGNNNYDMVKTESKTNIAITEQGNDAQTEGLHEVLNDADEEEEADKKVKFSTILLDGRRQSGNLNNINRDNKDTTTDLVLGSPSFNLLTNLDETWPDDLDPEQQKLTASVSKSVTSMGNITEWDEPIVTLNQHGQSDSRSLAILQESNIEGDEEVLKKHNFDPGQITAANDTNQIVSTDKTLDEYQAKNISGGNQSDIMQADTAYSGNETQSNDLETKTPLEITGTDKANMNITADNRAEHFSDSDQTGKLRTDIKYSKTKTDLINLSIKKPVRDNSMMEINNKADNKNENPTKSGLISDNTHKKSSATTRSPSLFTSKNVNNTTKLSPKVNDSKKEMPNAMSDKLGKTFESTPDISPKSTVESITQKTVRPIPDQTIDKDAIKFDYRVNIKHAPAWLHSGNFRGLCSDSCNKDAMQKRQENLRKWCKSLDKEFEGMQVWNSWMKDVCSTIISFKLNHRQDTQCWVKLKHNVDKSSANWERKHLQSRRILICNKNRSQDTYLQHSTYECKCEQLIKTEAT